MENNSLNAIKLGDLSRSSHAYGDDYLAELHRIINRYSVPEKRILLEWGMGNSTKFFLENRDLLLLSQIYSLDHSEEYYETLLADLPHFNEFHSFCIDLMGPKKSDRDTDLNFANFPLSLSKKFDVIYIDGRRRLECAFVAAHLCHPGSIVILHDYRRERYQCVKLLYDVLEDGSQFRVMKLKSAVFHLL